jgi:putative transposase
MEEGRDSKPSAASIDSQSVKTTEKRGRYMDLMEGKRLKVENDIF